MIIFCRERSHTRGNLCEQTLNQATCVTYKGINLSKQGTPSKAHKIVAFTCTEARWVSSITQFPEMVCCDMNSSPLGTRVHLLPSSPLGSFETASYHVHDHQPPRRHRECLCDARASSNGRPQCKTTEVKRGLRVTHASW